MKVVLVSQDRELYEVCRSTLRQFSIEGPIVEAAGARHGHADLTIWDISSGTALPERKDDGSGSIDLFVVSKASLPEVHKLVPAGFGFLLKPVKQPVLGAFLAAAIGRGSEAGDKPGHPSKPGRSDRDELLQILLEANLRLQQFDQERTNFLARALHDFRTPLTALQGYCGMLIRQSAGPLDPVQIELLERMQYSIGRLAKMSGSMFELTVRHNTERKLNLVRSNIDTCVQSAVDQIMPMAQNKEINVSVDLDPPDTHLYLDPGSIEQVLLNLLENACKFTRRNGTIQVSGRLVSWERGTPDTKHGPKEPTPAYRLEVRDNGMGILPEHLDSIFEEYTSYAGAQDRSGGGLGLAICRMLVREHQGAIWAESDRVETRMSFVLPLRQEMVLTHNMNLSQTAAIGATRLPAVETRR